MAVYRINEAIVSMLKLTQAEALAERYAEAQAAEELPRDFVPIFVCMVVRI